MNKEKFDKLKIKIKKAVEYMVSNGEKEENIKIVFNEKYKNKLFLKNIYLEYDNLQDDVDFIVSIKYSIDLKDRYPYKQKIKGE